MNISTQDVYAKLSKASCELEKFPHLQIAIEEARENIYRPLQVAIVGEYNAGKSTFLNSLLQDSILPTGDIPTTGCLNFIRFGDVFSIVVHYKDGSSKSVTAEQLHKISSHNFYQPEHEQNILQQFRHIEIFKPIDLLRDIVFVDTPGLNAPALADQEITEKLLNESDAIIWLTSARQVLSATEIEILELFADRYKDKSLCVISQVDSLNNPEKEVPELLSYAKKTLDDYFSDIVAISAADAIKGRREAIAPFYNSFLQHIVPKSQEMVAQAIWFDSLNLIDNSLDEFQSEKEKIIKLADSLSKLKQENEKETHSFLQKTKSIKENTSRELRRIQDNIISRIESECTTWKDQEPYTQKIPGIFVDDYVVKYKEKNLWHWDQEKVKNAQSWLFSETDNAMNKFTEQVKIIFESYISSVEQKNNKFMVNNSIILDELNFGSINTVAQHLMVWYKFQSMIDVINSFFIGAIKHGGVYPVSWLIYMKKSEKKFTTGQIREFVEDLLPLNNIVKDIINNNNENKDIVAAAGLCYDWLDHDISIKMNNSNDKIECLKKAKTALISDSDSNYKNKSFYKNKNIKNREKSGFRRFFTSFFRK